MREIPPGLILRFVRRSAQTGEGLDNLKKSNFA